MLRGEIRVGEFVFLAVQRHYQDLQDGHKRGLRFSHEHAWHCIDWMQSQFHHIKGVLAGTPLVLDPWQLFWTAVLMGWRDAKTGLRRFRTGYEEVARKNGKSTWKAALLDYLFLMDGEPGAEVYTVATTRDQAMQVFRVMLDNAKRRVRLSPTFAKVMRVFEGSNQERLQIGSNLARPLPANAENLDGLNPSAICVDELHAHQTREVWDVMESALGARQQPLISAITTAGFILDGICVEIRNYLVSILRGEKQDDSFFGYIYTLDPDDDPFDERMWIKANPSLGSAKSLDYLKSVARKAKALPSALANFLTKDLNVWVNSAISWFDMSVWDKGGGKFDPAILAGRECFGGLDLSSTRDLTAFVLVFPPEDEDGIWYVLSWTFAPRAKVETSDDTGADYAKWERGGWLTVTEGDVTDYGAVREVVREVCRVFDVKEVAFDVWNATHLAQQLIDDDVPMVQLPQTFAGIGSGSKQLERLVYSKRFAHGGNPVLRWCAGNVRLQIDTNENIRPDKKKSDGRIDPIVALCSALTRAMVYQGDAQLFVAL